MFNSKIPEEYYQIFVKFKTFIILQQCKSIVGYSKIEFTNSQLLTNKQIIFLSQNNFEEIHHKIIRYF